MGNTTIKDKLPAIVIVFLASVGMFTILYASIIGAKNLHTYFTEEKSNQTSLGYHILEGKINEIKEYILKEKCEEMGGEYKEEELIVVNNTVLSFYKDHCMVGGKKYIGNFSDLTWIQVAEIDHNLSN